MVEGIPPTATEAGKDATADITPATLIVIVVATVLVIAIFAGFDEG